MFWRRTLSVVVLVPLVLLVINFGGWFFLILVSAAVLMMQVEYCKLSQHFSQKLNPIIPAALTVGFCLLAYFLDSPTDKPRTSIYLFGFLLVVFIYTFASSIYKGEVKGELLTVTLKLTGILTIGWAFGYHCILLQKINEVGTRIVFLLIGTIWCSDTAAYLIGKAVGKHKLSTPISPHKTIEGIIAGLVVGTLVCVVYRNFLLIETLSLTDAAFIGLLLSVLGQLGDLSVSLMKRTAGVKDSGDFIPGHGGFLDRCDSLIFAAPFLYYYLAIVGIIK